MTVTQAVAATDVSPMNGVSVDNRESREVNEHFVEKCQESSLGTVQASKAKDKAIVNTYSQSIRPLGAPSNVAH